MSTEIEEVDRAAQAIAEDMLCRPPSASDGIWRFDRILDKLFEKKTKAEWLDLEGLARELNKGKDTWDRGGYGIVASYAQTRAAYATPGFAEARSKYMT